METKVDVSCIVTPDSITVNYSGQTHTIMKADARYEKIKTAMKERRKDDVPAIVASPVDKINAYGDGKINIENGVIRVDIDGVMRVVPGRLASKIIEHQKEDLPIEGLMAFAKNLLLNPSWHANQQLFNFLEKNNHPITDDGRFIAYKAVRKDFKDKHTGTFDNSPGLTVKMPRNEVDDNPNQTCSSGLHVANWDYAYNTYGGHHDTMLEVLVNPRDVVAVPTDYNEAKMRVCEYHVLGVVQQPTTEKYRSVTPDPTPAPNDTTVAAPPPTQDAPRSGEDADMEPEPANDDDDGLEGQLPLKQFCASCGVSLASVEDGSDEHEWNCAQEGIGADAIAEYTELKNEYGEATATNAIAEKYGSEMAERLPNSFEHLN